MSETGAGSMDPKMRNILRDFGFAVAFTCLANAGMNWAIDFMPGAYIMTVNGSLVLVNQIWLRRMLTQNHVHHFAMLQTALCFAGIVSVTYFSGGLQSPVMVWVAMVPVAATLLFGLSKKTVFWLCMTLLAVVAFGSLPLLGVHPVAHYPRAYDDMFHACSLFGFTLLLFALTQIFESAKNHALRESECRNHALQRANGQVEAAYVAKSRFLAAASHDLRQPAHALGMLVSRLNQLHTERAQKYQDSEGLDLVRGVAASTQALQELLDVVFDYSRLESYSQHNAKRPVNLNLIFEQLRVFFANTAAAKGLRLRIRPTRHWVISDPILLQRVLLNLVSNAIKYTRKGTVLVSCRLTGKGRHAHIQIWDSGIGIHESLHKTVFEEFFQIENPERERAKGLGMGLSMVERSCRLLNHPLTLRSQLGCGSRFTVSMATVPAPVPQHNTQEESHTFPDVRDARVWVVEDHLPSGMALQGLLASWGCNPSLFETVEQAHTAVQQGQEPDFIISDYHLRDALTGIYVIESLREKIGRKVAACLLSADLDDEVKQLARQAELVLLKKPLRPAKLRSLLRRSLMTGSVPPPGGPSSAMPLAQGASNFAPWTETYF